VVEHLLVIQKLEDGGHPGELAEIALENAANEQEEPKSRRSSVDNRGRGSLSSNPDSKAISKAETRIGIMRQFSDLGFPIERIVAALRTTSWDKDRALDILLT
jgi:hypothetical protein